MKPVTLASAVGPERPPRFGTEFHSPRVMRAAMEPLA